MDKRCIIDKRKLKLTCILSVASIIGVFLSESLNILWIPSIILLISSIYVSLRYIRCSNCHAIILPRNLIFNSFKYCKNCGAKIDLE